MHGYVVFDNNAYKRVSPDRLARILNAEREQGIIALASAAVLQEMLARVRDCDEGLRRVNRAAVRKLGRHCRRDRDGQTDINFISHTDSQLYRLLSGEDHPDDTEMFNTWADLVRVVTEAAPDDDLASIADDLDSIETHVAQVEAEYVAQLAQVATAEGTEPNEIRRNLAYAARLVDRAQALYGRQFTREHIVTKLVDAMKLTSIGFALHDAATAEVRAKRGGYAQHHNTVWDEEIVSATSMYTTVSRKAVLVVTCEDRIITAAAKAGSEDRVVSLRSYERIMGLSELNVDK